MEQGEPIDVLRLAVFQLGIFNPDPSPSHPTFPHAKKNISESGCGEIEFAIAVRERRSHCVFTQNGTRDIY